MTETLDANEYGSFSTKWVLRKASKHVPREQLEAAFSLALEYVDGLWAGKGVLAPGDALDAFGQMLLVGGYIPTAFPPRTEIQRTLADDDDEDEDEETPGEKWLRENPITEEEVERAAEFLDSLPSAEDPNE